MKPCKKCDGSGKWWPDGAPFRSDRDCVYCDGSGEVLTIEEEREASELERRARLFEPRSGERAQAGPIALKPRRAHCQRSFTRARSEPGGDLGTVPWDEHVAACKALGRDPEREQAAGGLGWDEMCRALGREARGWVGWSCKAER